VTVVGNLKFDITPPPPQLALGAAWRARFGPRPVLLAASTRDGEEAFLLRAFADTAPADVLLLLVPRHPQRFDAVADLVQAAGLPFQRRSTLGNDQLDPATRVVLATAWANCLRITRRAMLLLWRQFAAAGRQNLIEAASVGGRIGGAAHV